MCQVIVATQAVVCQVIVATQAVVCPATAVGLVFQAIVVTQDTADHREIRESAAIREVA